MNFLGGTYIMINELKREPCFLNKEQTRNEVGKKKINGSHSVNFILLF